MAVLSPSLPAFPLSRLDSPRLFESGRIAVRAPSLPAFPLSRLNFPPDCLNQEEFELFFSR
jgi:hypothetical protein